MDNACAIRTFICGLEVSLEGSKPKRPWCLSCLLLCRALRLVCTTRPPVKNVVMRLNLWVEFMVRFKCVLDHSFLKDILLISLPNNHLLRVVHFLEHASQVSLAFIHDLVGHTRTKYIYQLGDSRRLGILCSRHESGALTLSVGSRCVSIRELIGWILRETHLARRSGREIPSVLPLRHWLLGPGAAVAHIQMRGSCASLRPRAPRPPRPPLSPPLRLSLVSTARSEPTG